MTFLIFLIILGVLVFVHELGHFLVAKRAGVRVDEFGFGYPPRALKIGEKWGTLFTLNWIPFGGFVKILGENYEEDSPQKLASPESPRVALAGSTRLSSSQVSAGKSFTQVSKKWQAAMLVAGITFNILFAWLLFSLGFMIGLPTPVDNNFGGEVKNPALTITGLLDSSPAQKRVSKPVIKSKIFL
jgi:regulator of sigma E protease